MTAQKRVLVTGASGFIGSHLVAALAADSGYDLVVAGRRSPKPVIDGSFTFFDVGDIGRDTDWRECLVGVDVVMHLAGLAHLNQPSQSAAAEFDEVNVQGTLNLARQAASAGATQFLFLSSIGANGNASLQPFTPRDLPAPKELYAESKLVAEQELKSHFSGSSMAVTIVRPPLVYGPNAPGNFGLLCSVVKKQVPLPLAGIKNRRSFVSVWNLVDLLVQCMNVDAAKGETFLVRDGQDISTSDLLKSIGEASGDTVRLFRVPHWLLKLSATMIGKSGIYDRLFDSLEVDDSYTRTALGWSPPYTLQESLRKCFVYDSSV